MRIRNASWIVVLALALCVALAGPGLAQISSTGKLTGVVTSEGQALPGVTVTATSPALQGARVTQTTGNGSYVFPSLAAGDYEITFELEGFAPKTMKVKISTAQLSNLEVKLGIEEVTEEIVVTGEIASISEATAAQSTYTQDMIEKLSIGRNVRDITLLAPAVHSSGPTLQGDEDEGGAITISGSQSYENLFMINGVTVNDNARGQALDLYIEDAVQETTISTSGVSAEFGRFSGGVVNVITKSGGNDFSGSFRVNVENQAWSERTPLSGEQEDANSETFEATLGGRILRDKIWFFLAARDLERDSQQTLDLSNLTIPSGRIQERQEYKLTITPHRSHTLVGSFLNRDEAEANDHFRAVDRSTVNEAVENPQELKSFNYTGLLTSNFFIEAQYSERDWTVAKGAGGKTTDRIDGSWIVQVPSITFLNSPVFCGVCVDQLRNNENAFLKASYFLSSEKGGTHDLVAGYDTFSDIVFVENHQSASDFHVWAFQPFIVRGQEVFPQFLPGGNSRLRFTPVTNPTQGSFFDADALFINDKWRVNDKLSLNLGLRFDENNAIDAGGGVVSDDSKLSPRFGVTYDFKGDGDLVLNASFGNYVHQINNGINTATQASSAGSLASFGWQYTGPAINPDPDAPNLVNANEAMRIIFDWFDSIGGTDNLSNRIFAIIPGVSTQIQDTLSSPHAEEITIGITKRIGNRGMFRADFVRREFEDFYNTITDTTTGTVTSPSGVVTDLNLLTNSNDPLERIYDGIHVQGSYRLNNRLQIAGTYAWSHARGNFDGETTDNGPLDSGVSQYPELKGFDANLPRGSLAIDQRHKLRVWAIWQAIEAERQDLSVSLMHSFQSGSPFGADGEVNSQPFVANFDALGYTSPPPTVDYFFTNRDAFNIDDIQSTDLAINYSFLWKIGQKRFEVFLQPEVINLFDEDGLIRVDDQVFDATNTAATSCNGNPCQAFNPFTETPVEGVHWAKGETFGKAIGETDFQRSRTFRFSVGFRF